MDALREAELSANKYLKKIQKKLDFKPLFLKPFDKSRNKNIPVTVVPSIFGKMLCDRIIKFTESQYLRAISAYRNIYACKSGKTSLTTTKSFL